MTEPQRRRPHYWSRAAELDPAAVAGALAALRSGQGRPAGSVPGMWRYYTTLSADGRQTSRLDAEHIALSLWAAHQQGRSPRTDPMHRPAIGLGAGLAALHRSGRYSQAAVDRRVSAAATASSRAELAQHLRGLVQQLRVIGQPLDYDRLVADLGFWDNPEGRARVQRRWGGGYFASPGTAATPADVTTSKENS